jgi:hypothetical protein
VQFFQKEHEFDDKELVSLYKSRGCFAASGNKKAEDLGIDIFREFELPFQHSNTIPPGTGK